ncbi:MAG: HD domain-containing protein [Chloroflexi bacterium]|nr:HD domain-containing protein [Chloroflexota bacterium]
MATVIHDNVLGPIELEAPLLALVDHSAMQRLRRLEQLGTASLVFPGARHTRLAHSIGAQEIMRRVWRRLEATEPPPGIDLDAEGRLLRAAALLHDLGHYPLSHVVEPIAAWLHHSPSPGLDLGLDTACESDWLQLAASAASHPAPASDMHHERLAAEIIRRDATLQRRIDAYVGRDDAAAEVRALLQGRNGPRYRRQLVASHFDVDRLDYLLRDAHNAGVRYGGVELDHLIRRMRLGPDVAGSHVVYVETRGQPALEHYLLARRFMYSQVIFHKTVTAFSVLVAAFWVSLATRDRLPFTSLEGLHQALDDGTFRSFDDHWLWNEAARRADPAGRGMTARIASALVDRQPPLLAWEQRARGTQAQSDLLEEFNATRRTIARAAGVDAAEIFLTDQVVTGASSGNGGLGAGEPPLVGDPGGNLRPISEAPGSALEGAGGQPERLARLYVLRSGDADTDAMRRRGVREAFLEHVDGPREQPAD